MPKLKIDSSGSFYEPIEVEIDGKVFTVRPMTRELLGKIDALDEEESTGKSEMPYKRLALMIPGAEKLLDKLDIRDIRRLTDFILDSFKGTVEEKKEPRPGSEKLPS